MSGDPADIERLKNALAGELEHWKATERREWESWLAALDARKEDVRATNEFSKEALKALMLINGGAAVALLAFLGGKSAMIPIATSGVLKGMCVLVLGVALAALALGLTPVVMILWGGEDGGRRARQVRVVCYALAALSVVAFLVGCGIAAVAIGR